MGFVTTEGSGKGRGGKGSSTPCASYEPIEDFAGVFFTFTGGFFNNSAPGHNHLHILVVDRRAAGLDVRRVREKTARRGVARCFFIKSMKMSSSRPAAGVDREAGVVGALASRPKMKPAVPLIMAMATMRPAPMTIQSQVRLLRSLRPPRLRSLWPPGAAGVVVGAGVALWGAAVGAGTGAAVGFPAIGVGDGDGAGDGRGVGASVWLTTTTGAETVVMASACVAAAAASAASGEPTGAAAAIVATSFFTSSTNVSAAATSDVDTPDESASTSS